MNPTFDTILSSILSAIDEGNGSANVDEILARKIAEMGLSAEGKDFLNKTNSMLEAFEETKLSLRKAKENGTTREVWMQEQLHDFSVRKNLDEKVCEPLITDAETEIKKCLTELIEKGE